MEMNDRNFVKIQAEPRNYLVLHLSMIRQVLVTLLNLELKDSFLCKET